MGNRWQFRRWVFAAITAALVLPSATARVEALGTIGLGATDVAYMQDFDTLAGAGVSAVVPEGWAFVESGTNANTSYSAGTGSSTTADTYSFGGAGSPDRAFGGLRGGALVPIVGAGFVNQTGAVIDRLAVSFTGEQWRAGVSSRNAADRLDFQLSTDATGLATGTWTDYDALDFASPNTSVPAGALDGNAAANRARVTFTIDGLLLAPGAAFWIRWVDADIASADDGLAIDDFSLVPGAAERPTDPAGAGAASPDPVQAGDAVLLTVAVTPGAHPASTEIAVTADLSAIGGATAQPFFDDGTNGDAVGADRVFSFLANISPAVPEGSKALALVVSDAQGRSAALTIGLITLAIAQKPEAPPVVDAGGPYTVTEGASVSVRAAGSDPDGDPLVFAWDLDDDGTFETIGAAATFSAGDIDGPSRQVVRVRATDPGGLTAVAEAEVRVANAAPTLAALPAAQAVQYSDPPEPVTLLASDVPRDVPLTVLTEWGRLGGDLQAGLPGWISLARGDCSATETRGECSWKLVGVVGADPGKYVVRAVVGDKDGDESSLVIWLDVLAEDARAAYTGPLYVSTESVATDVAVVTLAATIQDISGTAEASGDAWSGDVRLASVTFIDRATNLPIAGCGDLAVGLVNPGDRGVGSATCEWRVAIGGDAADFTVGIVVGGRYRRNASEDDAVILVARPVAGDFITGGGHVRLVRPAGERAGDPGTSVNFGFEVKHNKKGTNLQASVNIILRRTEADGLHVYQVRGNVATSLSVQSGAGKAQFGARVGIRDITNPLDPVSVDGNAVLQVTLTDRGEPGSGDSIGMTVWNRSGGLWFSGSWDGLRTVEEGLAGGNLVIH